MVRNGNTTPSAEYTGASYNQKGRILDTFEGQKIGPAERFMVLQLKNPKVDFVAIWKFENGNGRKKIVVKKPSAKRYITI